MSKLFGWFCVIICGGALLQGAPVRKILQEYKESDQSQQIEKLVIQQDTPLQAAKSFLAALQAGVNWEKAPYRDLTATSPYLASDRVKTLLIDTEALRNRILAVLPHESAFVDEASLTVDGDLAMAYVMVPSDTKLYTYTCIPLALFKRDGRWQVSLTPGSFKYNFLPFDQAVRARATELTASAFVKAPVIAERYAQAALQQAVQELNDIRQHDLPGKTDAELMQYLVQAIRGKDCAKIAAILVEERYKNAPKSLAKSNRLEPVRQAMRLESRRPNYSVGQPNYLNFLADANVILVPLRSHPADRIAPYDLAFNRSVPSGEAAPQEPERKQLDRDVCSLAAFTILPRMRLPSPPQQVLVHRFALEKENKPLDGVAGFVFPLNTQFQSWNMYPDKETLWRIITDFHQTYPPLYFDTLEQAIQTGAKALAERDSLTLIRMLHPKYFQSVEYFVHMLTEMKNVLLGIPAVHARNNPANSYIRIGYVPSEQETQNSTVVSVGIGYSGPHVNYSKSLELIKTEQGWVLEGMAPESDRILLQD